MEEKVSVVMCSFNGEKYLIEQIESIINQSFPIYEIIIQDDCSTDSTWDILQRYSNEHSNLHIFRNEKTLGIYSNFFSAFQKVTGNYIAISDQDDVWFPDKILKSIECLKMNNAKLVYSDSIMADSALNNLGIVSISDISFIDCIFGVILRGHSIIVKKSVVNSIRNWEEISFAYDLVITLAALSQGKIVHLNEPLTIWRRHSSTVSKIKENDAGLCYYNMLRKKNSLILSFTVLRFLIKKGTVPNFKWFYSNLCLVLFNFKENDYIYRLYKFTYWYSKETVFGILFGSFLFSCSEKRSPILYLKAFYRPIYYYYQLMTIYFETFRTWH